MEWAIWSPTRNIGLDEKQPRVNFSKKGNITFCWKKYPRSWREKNGHIFGPHIGCGQQGSLCFGIIHQFWNHLERFPSTGVQAEDDVTDVKEVWKLTCVASAFFGTKWAWSLALLWIVHGRVLNLFTGSLSFLSLGGISTQVPGVEFKGSSRGCVESHVVPPSWGLGQTEGKSTSGRRPTP